MLAAALLIAGLVIACGGQVDGNDDAAPAASDAGPDTGTPPSLYGVYGYQAPSETTFSPSATLDVDAQGVSFSGDCLTGSFAAIIPDATGAFSANGTLTTVGGGGQVTYPHATLSGVVQGTSLDVKLVYSGTNGFTGSYGPVVMSPGLTPSDAQIGCI